MIKRIRMNTSTIAHTHD